MLSNFPQGQTIGSDISWLVTVVYFLFFRILEMACWVVSCVSGPKHAEQTTRDGPGGWGASQSHLDQAQTLEARLCARWQYHLHSFG